MALILSVSSFSWLVFFAPTIFHFLNSYEIFFGKKFLDISNLFRAIQGNLKMGRSFLGSFALKHASCQNCKKNCNWLPCEQRFSLSCMAFSVTKSFAWRLPSCSRSWPTTRQTSHANDFVKAKSHAGEKPLLAGYNCFSLIDIH